MEGKRAGFRGGACSQRQGCSKNSRNSSTGAGVGVRTKALALQTTMPGDRMWATGKKWGGRGEVLAGLKQGFPAMPATLYLFQRRYHC